MPSTLNTLIEGVSAIQRGNFSTAVELLKEYCQNYEKNSDGNFSDYIYAQQNIVKAYRYLGEKDKAIQLAKNLAINAHPQIRKWAKQVLASLSSEDFKSLSEDVIEDSSQPLWDNDSAAMVLQSVNQYLEFGSDSSIVASLETACESIKANTKEYFYAQVLLIEAYHRNGQFNDAVILCNQLIHSKHYLTRLLANKYLSSLSANQNVVGNSEEDTNNLLSNKQASVIYQQGYDALISKNYSEAVKILEKYSESTLPGTPEYLQASQFLVDVYKKNGKLEKATSLCIKLIKCKHNPSCRWARELLFTDLFTKNLPANKVNDFKDIQSKVDSVENIQNKKSRQKSGVKDNKFQKPVSQPFRLKTLDEFKQFFQKNLLYDFKVFEKRRKQAIATIIIWNITVLSILLFLFIFHPAKFFQSVLSNDNLVLMNWLDISAYDSISWLNNLVYFLFFTLTYLVLILILFVIYVLFYNFIFCCFVYNLNDKIIPKIFIFLNINQKNSVLSELEINQTIFEISKSQLLNGSLKSNFIEQNNLISGNINNVDIKFATVNINPSINHCWKNFLENSIIFTKKQIENHLSINLVKFRFLTLLLLPLTVTILLGLRILKGILYIIQRIIQGQNIDFQHLQTEIFKTPNYNPQVFRGIFFTAKFNNLSHAATIIQPKILATNINSLYNAKKQLIKLEDPEFNSLFTVYSEDKIQARYIVSTSLIEKLVKFRKNTNRNIYLSFIDNTIYIAVEYPIGIFEPNLLQSILRFAPVQKYFEAIQLILGIVEDLKLDIQNWKSS